MPGAVEEMLRWDSPVQFDVRTALEAIDLFGEPVEEGQRVVTLLGAANRDPHHFTDPTRFDITREEGPPMSFASGIHFCLGANLARWEMRAVFRELAPWLDSIEMAGPADIAHHLHVHATRSQPVRLRSAAVA